MSIQEEFKTKKSTLEYLRSDACKRQGVGEKLQIWLNAKSERRLFDEKAKNKLTFSKIYQKIHQKLKQIYNRLVYGNRFYIRPPNKIDLQYIEPEHIFGSLQDFQNPDSEVNKRIKEKENFIKNIVKRQNDLKNIGGD